MIKIKLFGIGAVCVLGLIQVIGCKPYAAAGEQQQGSDAKSTLGFGGSEKEFVSKYYHGYTLGADGSGINLPDSERQKIDAGCAEYAQGLIVGNSIGYKVYKDFQELGNGCGIGCNPAGYSFVGTMKLSKKEGERSYYACFITPNKKPICRPQRDNIGKDEYTTLCCDSNGKNCGRY